MSNSTFVAADGDGYELSMGRWSRRLAGPFIGFAGLPRGARVLDVGCGTGHLAGVLAADAGMAEVHAIDLAPVYIEHARRHYPQRGISFQVGDACAIDHPDAHFDAALAMLVLHFVPQAERAIAEMCRVTRPGGTVAATVWDARGGFVANRLFFDTAAALDARAGERRARNYTRPMTRPGELVAAWRAAGLVDIAEAVLGIRMEFASFADYWAPYLGGDGPGAEHVRALSDAERERLCEAVRAAYLDGEPDGPRSYAALAWAVRGRVPLEGSQTRA
ncbi:MAG TPA: class I SAM-dependent methyltransferase [Roseateles sp.]|nr:class I SAM-dependent methyltransferase [Roseateles sp.]